MAKHVRTAERADAFGGAAIAFGRCDRKAAAACVALAIMVNLVIYFTKDYNEPQICDMFASAYGSNQYDIASFDADDMAYFGYYGEE